MNKKLRLGLVGVFVLLLVGVLGVRWAARGDHFRLTGVRIDNAGLVDSAAVAEILRPWFGKSLLGFSTDSLEKCFMAIEGVDSVSVVIQLPETVIVSLKVGEPVAVIAFDDSLIPVTASGEPLPRGWVSDSFPVLKVDGNPDREVIRGALNILLKREISGTTSVSVDVNKITVDCGGVLVFLDPAHSIECWNRWQRVKHLVADTTAEVDLRFSNQVVLRASEKT